VDDLGAGEEGSGDLEVYYALRPSQLNMFGADGLPRVATVENPTRPLVDGRQRDDPGWGHGRWVCLI
jgi:hypothetical protein